MIAVHILSKEDVEIFRYIYEDLPRIVVYQNIDKDTLMEILEKNPGQDLMFIGHGDRNGLFDVDWRNYVVDEEVVPLLLGRKVIGFWCYASEFADIHGLHGFFTSNFISNSKEAYQVFFSDFPEEDVERLNFEFAKRVLKLLETGVDLSLWPDELKSEIHPVLSNPIERYNYETLCYYE